MNYSSPGASVVTVRQSSGGIYRNQDTIARDGGAFVGGNLLGATSAQYNHIQIFNPASSGVIILIDLFLVSAVAEVSWETAFYDTELTDDDGAWASTNNGGTDGAGHIRSLTQASKVGTVEIGMSSQDEIHIAVPYYIPVKLLEGEGYLIRNKQVNDGLAVYFRGREI